MLQWLILLMLFVQSSLAFGLYDDIDDYHIWRRGGPSIATTPSPIECRKDILVLWDNSNTVDPTDFKKVKNFLKLLIQNPALNVRKEGTNLAFISFASTVKLLLTFGDKNNAKDLVEWLNDLEKDRAGTLTRTGKAFQKASKQVFSERSPSNHRDHVGDVVLLLTDGAPNPIAKQTSKADEYAKILKSRNVTIIGLAIGNATIVRDFKPNIKEWATSPELVFEAEIENLQKITNELVDASCNTPDAGCRCPATATVNAEVKLGDMKAFVSWSKPEPQCEVTPSADNPQITSGKFSVGKHTLTYKYTHKTIYQKFDMECYVYVHVNIGVTGKFCGMAVYDPATNECCCGKIHRKKSGNECCGEKYYNPREEMCCQEAILAPAQGHCP